MTDRPNAYAIGLEQLRAERDGALACSESAEKERDKLRAQLEAVTAERDHMRSVVPELEAQLTHWKGRFVEPRAPTDLEMQTGPVAFERNQLRDEVAELRAKLAATTAHLNGAQSRAEQCEQDAHVSRTNLNTLSAMFRAAISAVVRA